MSTAIVQVINLSSNGRGLKATLKLHTGEVQTIRLSLSAYKAYRGMDSDIIEHVVSTYYEHEQPDIKFLHFEYPQKA